MITANDERTFAKRKYQDQLENAVNVAYDYIADHIPDFVKYDWGMNRVQKYRVIHKFDEIICEQGGFELDDRTLRHAHGIGNNSEYDIVDKELVKVGSFYCNSDMYGGIYTGVEVNGEILVKYKLNTRRAVKE